MRVIPLFDDALARFAHTHTHRHTTQTHTHTHTHAHTGIPRPPPSHPPTHPRTHPSPHPTPTQRLPVTHPRSKYNTEQDLSAYLIFLKCCRVNDHRRTRRSMTYSDFTLPSSQRPSMELNAYALGSTTTVCTRGVNDLPLSFAAIGSTTTDGH